MMLRTTLNSIKIKPKILTQNYTQFSKYSSPKKTHPFWILIISFLSMGFCSIAATIVIYKSFVLMPFIGVLEKNGTFLMNPQLRITHTRILCPSSFVFHLIDKEWILSVLLLKLLSKERDILGLHWNGKL